jgi:hypothetical protein
MTRIEKDDREFRRRMAKSSDMFIVLADLGQCDSVNAAI